MAHQLHCLVVTPSPLMGEGWGEGDVMNIRNERGQSATEYMLMVAVIVLGLVAAASRLIPQFREGVEHLGENVVHTLEQNQEISGVTK